MNQLKDYLSDFINQNLSIEEVGILYSGGIDSSIIIKILIEEIGIKRIKPVTVGAKESHDVQNALNGARELGFELNVCLLDSSVVNSAIERIFEMNVVSDVGKLAIAIPLFVGLKFLSQKDVRVVFLGQGADELFGGYKKYAELYRESKEAEVSKMMHNDLLSLVTDQTIMEKQIARLVGITLVYPFLSPTVIKFAQSIPIRKHIIENKDQPIRKALLRKLAENLGLSPKIFNQPKKALQYGSGTVKLFRKIAKEAGYSNLPLWFENIS